MDCKFALGVLLFSATVLSTNAATTAAVESGPPDHKAIRLTLDALQEADTAGDVDAVIALYAEGAILMPPGKPLVIGKANIKAHYAALFAQTKLSAKILSDEIQVSGDWAFVRGTTEVTATPRAGGVPTQSGGKYLMIVRRDDQGKWKVARLFWDTAIR